MASQYIGIVFNKTTKQLERVVDPDDDVELLYISLSLPDHLQLERLVRHTEGPLSLGDVAAIQYRYDAGEI